MMVAAYADLAGKAILVTGASSGIGAVIAKSLSAQGAHVIISGRSEDKLAVVAREIGAVMHAHADLRDPGQRESLIDAMPELDGICHCAGIVSPFPVGFFDDSRVREVMEVNFYAPVALTSTLFQRKKIRSGAALAYISSVSSFLPYSGGAIYSAGKVAMEAYFRNVAIEYGRRRVRANFIRAGMVKTDMYSYAEVISKKLVQGYVNRYPLGLGAAEDVAAVALFLLSDASRWMTGVGVTVDGGFSLGQA